MDQVSTWRMSGCGDFSVGDGCFARIKGWIPFPAKILEIPLTGRKRSFQVLFYGELKTAKLDEKCIWPITPENIKKYVTASSLRRKGFKARYEEMEADQSELIKKLENEEIETGNMYKEGLETDSRPVGLISKSSEDDFGEDDLDFNSIFKNPHSQARSAKSSDEESDGEHGDGVVACVTGEQGESAVEEEEDRGDNASNDQDTNGEHDENPGDDAQESPEEAAREVTAQKKKKKQNKSVPGKKRMKKTLRENELEVNQAFAEKIILMENDGSFHCKDCPTFVTSVRLLARTHAQTCGSLKKKAGRRPKKLTCPDCGACCGNKKDLARHFQAVHTISTYNCSVCFKKFKSRKNYSKHLKLHDEVSTVSKCAYCPKTFRFKSYLKRHIKRVHVKSLGDAHDIPEENDEVLLQVCQKEVKIGGDFFWEYNVLVPGTSQADYGSFFNTLGFSTKEDWDDWMLVSQMMSLSVSAGSDPTGLEMAFRVTDSGLEEIICVGSGGQKGTVTLVDDVDEEKEIAYEGVIEKALGTNEEDAAKQSEVEGSDEGGAGGENCAEAEDGAGAEDGARAKASGAVSRVISCSHCGEAGFQDGWFLRRHVERMHLAPIKCEICQTVFGDKYWYLKHSKNCYFFCSVEGCTFHDKRKSRMEGHMRKHLRDS